MFISLAQTSYPPIIRLYIVLIMLTLRWSIYICTRIGLLKLYEKRRPDVAEWCNREHRASLRQVLCLSSLYGSLHLEEWASFSYDSRYPGTGYLFTRPQIIYNFAVFVWWKDFNQFDIIAIQSSTFSNGGWCVAFGTHVNCALYFSLARSVSSIFGDTANGLLGIATFKGTVRFTNRS